METRLRVTDSRTARVEAPHCRLYRIQLIVFIHIGKLI